MEWKSSQLVETHLILLARNHRPHPIDFCGIPLVGEEASSLRGVGAAGDLQLECLALNTKIIT